MKKLLTLLLIISMISTSGVATLAETVNDEVAIVDLVDNVEENEVNDEEEVVEDTAEVTEEVVEEDATDDEFDFSDFEAVDVALDESTNNSSNNENLNVEAEAEEETEEVDDNGLLGASSTVKVTIKPVDNIPFDGKTSQYTITVKKGLSLTDNKLYPNRQANGYMEPDIKKYNFPWFKNEVNGGDYYYQQIGWKIGKKEIKREGTNLSQYKINSNTTMSPIWRRVSEIQISTNGGEIYNKKLKENIRGSISYRVMENEVLQNVVEDSLGDIKREGYYFKGWKSVRYNKVYNSLKDYKSQGYIDYVSAQWEEMDKGPFISELKIASANSDSSAKNQLKNAGFKVISTELNHKQGGKYIYLGYKTTTDRTKAIRDLAVMYQKGAPNSINYGKEVKGKRPVYNKVSTIDLNEKAGGEYIYLYYTKDANAGNPIKEISFFIDETTYTFNGSTCTAHHPGKKSAQTYRNMFYNGDKSVHIVPVVKNNANTGIEAANLNSGCSKDNKVKNGKKSWTAKYKNWIGIGVRRSKN